MAKSVMGQYKDTWIKQECINMGISKISSGNNIRDTLIDVVKCQYGNSVGYLESGEGGNRRELLIKEIMDKMDKLNQMMFEHTGWTKEAWEKLTDEQRLSEWEKFTQRLAMPKPPYFVLIGREKEQAILKIEYASTYKNAQEMAKRFRSIYPADDYNVAVGKTEEWLP